jgi:lysozyme
MPSKKNKQQRFVRKIVLIIVLLSVAGMAYVVYLWFQNQSTGFVTYKEFGIPMPTNYAIHGIDVSRYQQRISWPAVKRMNVQGIQLGFAFIKATEGTGRTDPYFKTNWKKSKEAGLIRGAYHFFIASKDGRAQAKNFITRVMLEKGDLPPVLDVEQTFGKSSSALRTEVKEWLNVLENHYQVRPIIYTNADFYKQHLQGHFETYPLWVAHYLQPHQPRIRRDWSFWQHSEKGKVNGIFSRVDFNVFNGDSVQFKAMLVP